MNDIDHERYQYLYNQLNKGEVNRIKNQIIDCLEVCIPEMKFDKAQLKVEFIVNEDYYVDTYVRYGAVEYLNRSWDMSNIATAFVRKYSKHLYLYVK